MLCSITTICCAFSLATSDWWRNYLLPHHLYIFLRYKQKNKGIKFPGWWSQWILTIKVQVLDITRLRRQRTADVQTRCGSLRKLCLIGTSEHTTALPFRFFDIGSPETALAEETPVWSVRLIGSAEETPSFLFGFFERRSSETEEFLLEFIAWEDIFEW